MNWLIDKKQILLSVLGAIGVIISILCIKAFRLVALYDTVSEIADNNYWISTIYKVTNATIIDEIIPEPLLCEYRWCFFVVLLFVIIAWGYIYFYKERLIVLKHSTFDTKIEELSPEIKKRYDIKYIMLNNEVFSQNNLLRIIKYQDTQVNLINDTTNSHFGYYGIAHTPLIFRAGYMFGDQKNMHLFHKFRSNNSSFEEWEQYNRGYSNIIDVYKELNNDSHSDEMFVAISTTFEIREEEVKTVARNDEHIIFIKMNQLGFDVIRSYEQAEVLKGHILSIVRQKNKEYGIKKLHLMISSSVSFTFLLATGISKQHDPEIVVYHYEKGVYTWGINISKCDEEAVLLVRSNV